MRHFQRSPVLNRCVSLQLGAFLFGIIPGLCNAQTKLPTTPSTIYERTHLSVVVIVTADKDAKPSGQGSGFIVAKDKVVTNHHVIEGAGEVVVVFADGSTSEVEGIVADSPARDLTILSVNTGARSALKFGDELSVRQGDSVYAVGAPRGLELSITNGIVSGFRHIDEEFMIQNTAPIAPGSSGGPLFDRDGRVIGVTTSLLTDSPGIYFSIGAGDVRRLLRTPNIVVAPLPKRIESEKSASTSHPASSPSVKAESRTKTSLIVNSKPTGAAVFVNGIKQPGQTPVALPLSAGQYNLVLRLPGYSPYVGSVEVTEGATQIDAELKELNEDISGTYEGTVHNITVNQTARFSIFIKRYNQIIFGCMLVKRPLFGSGALYGSVDADGVYFTTTAPTYQIAFRGKKIGGKLTGTYRVVLPIVQVGDFELERKSSDAPSDGFDTRTCAVD